MIIFPNIINSCQVLFVSFEQICSFYTPFQSFLQRAFSELRREGLSQWII